eukprot:Gb_24701 [translate_table: standard]
MDSMGNKCAICLSQTKRGVGNALFIGECSHTFHFACILSNLRHGNLVCPICRAQWTQLKSVTSLPLPERHGNADSNFTGRSGCVQLRTIPEFPAIPRSEGRNDFAVLLHLRAPSISAVNREQPELQNRTSPVDLVAVLDVSRSMAGSKLDLLKKAMRFVIRNFGPRDRLSIIVFSKTARRLFSLRTMMGEGLQQAFAAVDLLRAERGTNIGSGLRMGIKELDERRQRNPVSSIILLSDGLDNYCNVGEDYGHLLPESIREGNAAIPIHTFGFGRDHDPAALHTIAEASAGTFSFVENTNAIKEAFAQCIGGLLSVVIQDLKINIRCADLGVEIASIEAGSYRNKVEDCRRRAEVNIGELYAEEDRNVVVLLRLPAVGNGNCSESNILEVSCTHKVAMSGETIQTVGNRLCIRRPERVSSEEQVVDVEVDRQKKRLRVSNAIGEATDSADNGDIAGAQQTLKNAISAVLASASDGAQEEYLRELVEELIELQQRMRNMHAYRETGRAYSMSLLSSHTQQRASTASSVTQEDGSVPRRRYRTGSMNDMVIRSLTEN